MKKIICYISLFGLIGLINCGSEEDPKPKPLPADPIEQTIEKLAKTWKVKSVTLDGSSVTDDWTGFTLSFDKSRKYTAKKLSEKSALVWPPNGSYTFPKTSNPNVLLRHDGVEIVLSGLTDSSVKLSFTISGRTNGRATSLVGDYVFEMSK